MEMKKSKTAKEVSGQMSLMAALRSMCSSLSELTAEDIARAAQLLGDEADRRKAREDREKVRREEEKRRREEQKRKAQEEKERQEAHIRQVTCMELPMDWDNAFCRDDRAAGVHADSIPDGLVLSLSNLGRVDIEYIAAVTGADYKTVIETLRGSIYQNPETWDECFYRGWETAEEYLSGNLMRKYAAAREADKKYAGYFGENLRAIEAVMPAAVATEDIYITLGSPWVPADIIDDFIEDTFRDPRVRYYYREETAAPTRHDALTGAWEIPGKGRFGYSVLTDRIYGTRRMGALYILEKTLNGQTPTVYDEVSCTTTKSGKRREINRPETAAAMEKQKSQIAAFQNWVWKDAGRARRLYNIYQGRFGCMRRRLFDGSFLTFPTMSDAVRLYPYQKNAVARILFTPNTLLAHDVGSGKTYVMIAAGQEMRRMGLSRKNLYVVPNNIVGQWREIFAAMYPQAKLLCVEPRSFTPAKRQQVLSDIRDGDYDGIIMAYSCFKLIPLSKEYYREELQRRCGEVQKLFEDKSKNTNAAHRRLATLREQLAKLETQSDEPGICFDELGIDRLFVDEAHNFKNVPFETKTERVLGLNPTGSKKCAEMLQKVRHIQHTHDGRGVVFATGTPITNSVTDVFTLQRYLQSGELAMLELQSFDGWLGMFAERSTEFEIDVDTSSYRMASRFARFHNLPELTALLASFADFHQVDASAGIPDHAGYEDGLVPRTEAFRAYLKDVSRRADDVRKRRVKPAEDNMLKITTDGRKAALDLRLIDEKEAFDFRCKAAACAENAAKIYRETAKNRSTQLIFCDTSVPKDTFNLYDEMRRLLVAEGVADTEIAYIHDAATEAAREKLFARVRRGEVRILLGSTFKLGLGVNIQDRLIALHHLDVPWRPADMTQREGRILRQGNENERVALFRYITEGSFDAYSWQLLETKQRFISALLSGSLTERSGSDVDDTVLSYAEVKALAVGNPLVKERVECQNELSRYRMLESKRLEARAQMEREKLAIPAQEDNLRRALAACRVDAAAYAAWEKDHPTPEDAEGKKALAEARRRLRSTLRTALEDYAPGGEKTVMTYRGVEVALPGNMLPEKPYVWLIGAGRYYVELGDDPIGNLLRIDHALEGLPRRGQEMETGLATLAAKKAALTAELEKQTGYGDDIARCEAHLRELDEKLEVKI